MKKHLIRPLPEDHEIMFMAQHRVTSQVIYVSVLLAITGLIISLPLIKVTVSMQSHGIIRPVYEVADIRVIPSAPVLQVNVCEGSRVRRGDTMLLLAPAGIDSKLEFEQQEIRKINNYILDLQCLTNRSPVIDFHSDLYNTQYISYRKRLSEINLRIDRACKDIVREEPLFRNKLISNREYEELLFNRDQLENEKKIIESGQDSQWRSELTRWLSERDNCITQIDQLNKQRELYVVKSPIAGTIESFSGIYPGSNVQSGQTVAQVSPDNTLIAEVYVPAAHVGMLFPGMPVNMQVDAFNYHEWGMISGQIKNISDDYYMVNQVPVFKIKCSLNANRLTLKNGTSGSIKKGMTLNVRFIIAERSLFQLLYQKSDDWLNPGRNIALQK
jgi:multidrug resistance efflux pump